MSKQTDHYGNLFKGWPKQIGAKPTDDVLTKVHAFARPGKQALALGLMLRESGVTGAQIVMACGAPQLNKMRDLCHKGYVKRVPAAIDEAGHTVYKLALTAKGEAKVKAAAEKPVDADKPAKAAKRKAKAAKAEPAAVVNDPAAAQAEQMQAQADAVQA